MVVQLPLKESGRSSNLLETTSINKNKAMLNLTTNRILKHLQDDEPLAIISVFRTENSPNENMKLHKAFKNRVKSMKLGFSELASKWVETDPDTNETISSDERSLMIYRISLNDAMDLGEEYSQSSIIFKDANRCAEVCTRDFVDANGKKHQVGNIVRVFKTKSSSPLNLDDAKKIFDGRMGGPASKPIKSNRSFTLKEVYEVESPRGSVFSNGEERYIRII